MVYRRESARAIRFLPAHLRAERRVVGGNVDAGGGSGRVAHVGLIVNGFFGVPFHIHILQIEARWLQRSTPTRLLTLRMTAI